MILELYLGIVLPAQESGPGRGTVRRVRVSLGKAHALSGKGVDVGSFVEVPIHRIEAIDVRPAQVIREDEDDVRGGGF